MSEADDANYRRRITDVLLSHGFGWVVAQAEAHIAEGKPTSKQVSERDSGSFARSIDDDGMFVVRHPRTRRASLITSEPYTQSEQLEILLEAIEAAIVQRSMLEQAVLDESNHITSVRYEPDSPGEAIDSSYFGTPQTLDISRIFPAKELEVESRLALDRMKGRDDGDPG